LTSRSENDAGQIAEAESSQQESDESARELQQHAFEESLPEQLWFSGADRSTDSCITPTGRGPSAQEVGNAGTGD